MYKTLVKEIKEIINNIGEKPIFTTETNKEEIKDKYLTILNDGEPILKQNKTYTCNFCIKFLNDFGSVIWYEDGSFVSIWDKVDTSKFNGKFLKAIEEIREYINNFKEPTEYKFFKDEKIGIEKNTAIKKWYDGRVEVLTFTHLHGEINQINTTKSGGFARYYRLNEAKELINKAKKLNQLIEDNIANKLIEEVQQLKQYENNLEKVEEIASYNPYEKHINRNIKLSNLLFTCMVKAEEEGMEKAINFAKIQTRADRFMQEKGKSDEQLMREYNELQKQEFVFSGLEEVEPTYVFKDNRAKETTKNILNPQKISRKDFINLLNNEKVHSLALIIKEDEIDARKATALKQKDGETQILKQPIITIYKTGYTDALWKTVKKHGGNINSRNVFSLIFGQPCYNEQIDGMDIPDLDLHCVTPSKREIFYATRGKVINGLTLDVDMKVSADKIVDPIENIYGDNPSDGKYLFYVDDFTSPQKRGKHLNNFICIFKSDDKEYETEVVEMDKKRVNVAEIEFENGKATNIKWLVPVKNKTISAKDIIKSKFKYIPIKAIIDANDQILFDVGLNSKFTTKGINKEYLKQEYQRYNQVIKLIAEDVEAKEMIAYKNHSKFIVEFNGKTFIVGE